MRWNRVNGHLIATAHEGDVRIWDTRKVAPVQYIAAHLHKIHGLDWSINQENQLATSSQDCTVKFFDVENPRVVENALRTICPVWRARYTVAMEHIYFYYCHCLLKNVIVFSQSGGVLLYLHNPAALI